MGIIDRLRGKSPEFNIGKLSSSLHTWDAVTPSTQYLDQYEHWTYKAIRTITDGISKSEVKLYQKKGKEVTELTQKNSSMLRDLYYFNPLMSYHEARRITQATLQLTGSAFWYMVESEQPKQKADFYILDSQSMSLAYDEFGLPSHYIYRTGSGSHQDLSFNDVIAFKLANPKDIYKGHSPLQSARYAHNIVELGMKYNMNVFGNSGRPEGFMIIDGAGSEERDLVESKLKEKFGGVQNARKIGVLNRVATWLPISEKPKDLDYARSIEMFRDQILAIFGVPKTLVGIEDAINANAAEAMRVFQMYTLEPLVALEAEVLTNQLIPKYHGMIISDMYFKADDVVESDKKLDAEVASALYSAKIITIDEAREQVGLEPLEENQLLEPKEEVEEKPEEPVKSEEIEKKLTAIMNRIKNIDEDLSRVPEIEEQKKNRRDEMRKFFENEQDERELVFRKDLWSFFSGQRERVLKSLVKKKSLSLKGSVDWEQEVAIMLDLFNKRYEAEAKKANAIANELIGQQTEISEKSQKAINERLQFFAKETNKTTQEKIEKIIANGVRNSTNPIVVADELNLVLSGFMEGEANIKLLKDLGVYVDDTKIASTGTINRNRNRFEKMYNTISELEGEKKMDALKALYAITDENDPVALAIRDNIKKTYGIGVDDTKLSRLWTIARTEIGAIQSEIQYDNYKNSGVVQKLEWLSARDMFVRGLDIKDHYDHASADGQVIYIGEKFLVSGELLERPHDPAGSIGNTINCRCVAIPRLD